MATMNQKDGIDEVEGTENAFNVAMERYGYDRPDGEQCDLGESEYLGGIINIINMTEEVNDLRRPRCREMYYNMTTLHEGE